jgi:hypothetical protein
MKTSVYSFRHRPPRNPREVLPDINGSLLHLLKPPPSGQGTLVTVVVFFELDRLGSGVRVVIKNKTGRLGLGMRERPDVRQVPLNVRTT